MLAAEAAAVGATLESGPEWQGYYYAAGGAKVINRLLAAGRALPRAIACANDLTALGVMSALREHGISVPGQVAVTGFDDIPLARHLRTTLTTVRQPIREMGRTAFEVLYSMIGGERPPERDIVLATDGPEMIGTRLRAEYQMLVRLGALSRERARAINERAHEVSFVNGWSRDGAQVALGPPDGAARTPR